MGLEGWCALAALVTARRRYCRTDVPHLPACAGELRWQQTADLTIGFPPLIIAKGPNVTFTAGSPLAFWPADMPGFTTVRGRGLLGYGRYNCSDTVRSWECTRDGTMESLMQACDGDSQCAVVALKQRECPKGVRSVGAVACTLAALTLNSAVLLAAALQACLCTQRPTSLRHTVASSATTLVRKPSC